MAWISYNHALARTETAIPAYNHSASTFRASALDAESEEKIKVTLENISMKITTITIAHRISTIINSDRIVVLNEGKINAIGTHEDLMKNCDLYRRMALLQNIE